MVSKKLLPINYPTSFTKRGFTIVELLVVIVVIGILAAITIVSYTGISSKATTASLQSDLTNSSKLLKLYQVEHSSYPTSFDANNCPLGATAPSPDTKYCIKPSGSNSYNMIKSNNNINPQTFCLGISNSNNKYYVTDSTGPSNGSCVSSCLDILNAGNSIGSGVYSINPGGVPLQVYCDMTNDGGGWTLVLQNNSTIATPSPAWKAAINDNNISGTMGSNQANFDVLLGLGYWNNIGTQLKVQVGTSPTAITNKATYNFSLNSSNNYAINLSNQSILLGVTSPGVYTSHNNLPFTTYDADHDTYSTNCATVYNNHPWWYHQCWSGNYFAGGSYQEAAYWNGTTEYFAHGSFWIK